MCCSTYLGYSPKSLLLLAWRGSDNGGHTITQGVEIEITWGQHCGAKIQLGAIRISIGIMGSI